MTKENQQTSQELEGLGITFETHPKSGERYIALITEEKLKSALLSHTKAVEERVRKDEYERKISMLKQFGSTNEEIGANVKAYLQTLNKPNV